MVPASVQDKYVIRFCAVAQNASEEDIQYAWDVIVDFATELLEKEQMDNVTEMFPGQKKPISLAQKRSFFVRMVSDPRIYNPAISLAASPRLSTDIVSPTGELVPQINTP